MTIRIVFLGTIEPIAPEPTKRSVGSSSSAAVKDLEDDSEQEDDDLGKEDKTDNRKMINW